MMNPMHRMMANFKLNYYSIETISLNLNLTKNRVLFFADLRLNYIIKLNGSLYVCHWVDLDFQSEIVTANARFGLNKSFFDFSLWSRKFWKKKQRKKKCSIAFDLVE